MEVLDTRQLRSFAMLAETGSFTAAAEKLFLTQSAVSHSIKSLESQLEAVLFERAGKRISLTPAGEQLLGHAHSILSRMEQAAHDVAAISRQGYGRIRIGAAQTACQYILPAVMREFRECFPNCEVSISPGDTAELLEMLENGQIDLAFSIRMRKGDHFEFRPLFDDELAYAYSPMHPWAKVKELNASHFRRVQFIVYAKQSFTARLVETYFQKIGWPMPAYLELGAMEAIKEFAKIGMGVGIIAPWVAKKEIEGGSLVIRPLAPKEDAIEVRREWGMFALRNRQLSMAEETLIGLCESVCR
ncbi:MAG: LysR family transcriptional regulator [Verrucomicrobiota bacterium]